MDNEKSKIKSNVKKYLVFLLAIFCFVCLPALILSYSVYSYYQTNEELIVNNLKTYNQHITNELRRNTSAEKYFCSFFHEYNLSELRNHNSTIESCISFCKNLKKKFKDNIDFVVLTNEAEIKYNSNSTFYNHPQKIWYEAYNYVRYNYGFSDKTLKINNNINRESLKQIFGSHIIYDNLQALYWENIYSLIWGDYTGKIPPGAVYSFRWGGLFVFISRELLKGIEHLKWGILENSKNSDITTGLYDINNVTESLWTNSSFNIDLAIKDVFNNLELMNLKLIETDKYYIYLQPLTNNYNLFTLSKKKNTNNDLLLKSLLVFLIYCAFSWHIIKYFINTIVLRIPGEVSISFKIAFLFAFATIIPLVIFAIVSHEYEMYKRQTLIKEARVWAVENVLNTEQRYQSYLKNISNYFDNCIIKWKNKLGELERLKDKKYIHDYVQELGIKFFNYEIHDFYLVSSNTPYIISPEGLFKYEGPLDAIRFDFNNSIYNFDTKKVEAEKLVSFVERYKLNDYRLMIIIVKKVINHICGQDAPSIGVDKLEIIAESFMQMTLAEIIYYFIEIENEGIIKEWGFGDKIFMVYLKIFSVNETSLADYMIIASWRLNDIQRLFLNDISTKINRNPIGYKFVAYEKYDRFFIPEIYKGNKELESLAKRADVKPTDELELINFNGEDYIAVSVLGKNLSRYSLVGLYPIKNIDNEIKEQKSFLMLLGILSLILSVGLAQLISKSFIKPLLILQEGALAIEDRNFKHRVSGLAADEFGEVGNIFNNAMVGLQELEFAKIVQESMFPKPEFKQGKFSIFGKSVTMIDVGGDYLDFFKVDDNSFSVLVGDVAGHGAGAAVIMAMAKAAILNAGDSLRSPASVLNQIHKIILAAKNSKQRKIMTFQYLHVNSETGAGLYGNAGGCSPCLVRHSENSIQEIKMAGPVLGAFKKAAYKEIPLDLKPGDAVIFYTDGIVECKNKDGEMLGYERMKEMFLDSWAKKPEEYYNNIYKAYIDYVGEESEASDDLTFVILMCDSE